MRRRWTLVATAFDCSGRHRSRAPILDPQGHFYPVRRAGDRVHPRASLSPTGDRGQTTTVDATLKTYHERIERGWPLTNDRHVMSPAYVYNQIKVPGPQGGAYFVDAFNVLIDKRPSARRGTVTHWSARASIGGHHRLHRRSTFI